MEQINTALLSENEHIKEFLALMEQNSIQSMPYVLSMFQQVGTMEKKLETMTQELSAMRKELQAAHVAAHPVRNAMQNAIGNMEKNIATLGERLSELKQNIIAGCKNAVATFKDKGVSALDNLARFFHARPALEAIDRTLDKAIQDDSKTISRFESMSREYHEAGLHLKNVGRALLGREAATEVKPIGKVAEAFIAPVRRERDMLTSMKKSVNKVLGSVEQLEQAAKPSIQETLQGLNAKIAQEQKPVPVKVRAVGKDER